MFGFSAIGPFELLLILTVALIVFGPKKLPEIGKAIGKAIRGFREQTEKLTEELSVEEAPETSEAGDTPSIPAPAKRARKNK